MRRLPVFANPTANAFHRLEASRRWPNIIPFMMISVNSHIKGLLTAENYSWNSLRLWFMRAMRVMRFPISVSFFASSCSPESRFPFMQMSVECFNLNGRPERPGNLFVSNYVCLLIRRTNKSWRWRKRAVDERPRARTRRTKKENGFEVCQPSHLRSELGL